MHHNKTTCTTPTHNATITQIKQHTCNVQKFKKNTILFNEKKLRWKSKPPLIYIMLKSHIHQVIS
jgi:hypothetical protein